METGTRSLCLAIAAQYHQMTTDPAQLRHQFADADQPFSNTELLRAAKAIGCKASEPQAATPIAPESGEAKDDEREFLIQDPAQSGPQTLSENQLIQRWHGEVILLTRRQGLLEAVREFDIRWFIPCGWRIVDLSYFGQLKQSATKRLPLKIGFPYVVQLESVHLDQIPIKLAHN